MLLDGGQLSEGGGGVIHGAYRNVHINPVKHTEAHTHTRLVSLAWSSSELTCCLMVAVTLTSCRW